MKSALPLFILLTCVVSCGGKKPPADPSGEATAEGELPKVDDERESSDKPVRKPKKKVDDKTASEGGGEAEGKGEGDEGKSKASLCTGFELDLLNALSHSACEVKDAKATDVKPVDMKKNLVVKASTSAAKVDPGGKVDVIVQFTNKGKEPLVLDFLLDPTPRLEIEAYDAKNKRVDIPAAREPIAPSGMERGATAQGVGRITIVPNGSAHAKIVWEASKMRWAPEKLKGTPPEMGFPRVPAGPLPKGRYTVKVKTRLLNVAEGIDHEVSEPKVGIDVGK